jgi:hypothetical protein
MLCMPCLVAAGSPTFPFSLHNQGEHEIPTLSTPTLPLYKTVFDPPLPAVGLRGASRRVALAPVFNFFFSFVTSLFDRALKSIRFAFFLSSTLSGVRIIGLSKSSQRRVPASHGREKGCISQLKFADEAQLRGERPYHPDGLISKVYWLGAHRLFALEVGGYRTSLDM